MQNSPAKREGMAGLLQRVGVPPNAKNGTSAV